MPTNYGYVKQDVDSQLNWAEVGKSFTDMLTAENDRRDTLKKEIDDNTRTDLERLSSIPRGGSEEMNRWTSSASDAITKQLLMYENALKTGKMDLKDYNTATANVRSGTKNMTTTIKSYNQWYEEGMKRAEAGDAQAAELWKNSLIESMKFKDTTPNIAYDGTMSVTKLVPSKTTSLLEISENPADSFSFSSILDFGKEKFDKFKADEKLNELAKVAGEYVKVYGQGRIATISDIFQKDAKGNFINKSGVDALNTSIDGMLSNDVNKMSILTDYLPANPKTGKTFEFTLDPNDPRLKGAGRDDIILMDKNNKLSPILTESQKKMAHDAMMQGLQARLGREEKFREPPQQPSYRGRELSESDKKRADEKKVTYGYMRDMELLQTGTPEDVETIANDRIADMNSRFEKGKIYKRIGKLQRTDTQFLIPITDFDPKTNKNVTRVEPISRVDAQGNLLPVEQVAQSLIRFLTPFQGSYREAAEDYKSEEGGFSGAAPSKEFGKGGRAFTPAPKVAISTMPIKTAEGKNVDAGALLEVATKSNNASKVAIAAQQILSAGLKGIESNIKAQAAGPITGDNALNIYIGDDVVTLKYEGPESGPALQSSIQNLINNTITKYNKKKLAEDVNRPKSAPVKKSGFNAEDFYNKNKSK